MARTAHIALLAYLLVASCVSYTKTLDSDESFGFFDYADSPEAAPCPKNHKVILRKVPKLNVTVKNKSDGKKRIYKTTINISSHTNIIVTVRPPTNIISDVVTVLPETNVQNYEEQLWVGVNMSTAAPPSRRKTSTSRKPNTRRPSQRPSTTKQPQSTTVRNLPTRRITTKAWSKTTKRTRKLPCHKKIAGCTADNILIDNRIKKTPKIQEKSGIFSKLYDWIVQSKSSWFNGGFFEEAETKWPTTTSTTPIPPSTSTPGWFQTLLDSEENDNASANDGTVTPKKKSIKKNYNGYQLLRAFPDQQWKIRSMLDLQEESEGSGVMWWTLPSLNGSTDLLVPPDLLIDVKDHLKSSNIDFDVIIWDLQKAISYENPKLSKKQKLELVQLRGHPMTWRRYHRYSDIIRYLEYLQHSYPDILELMSLGRSSEGLPLVAVKISVPSNETRKGVNKGRKKKYKLRTFMKPAVWIEGGVHGREWIAPAVASWMIHNLVEGEKGTGTGADYEMLKVADFYIMPVVNPDGYEHSHTHDRLWRKTRSRRDSEDYSGWLPWNWGRSECVGVDPDRNWDFHWGEQDSSMDPCSDNYAGPNPFSEPETRAVSNFLEQRRGQIKVYLSLHAYSQAWLLPSSHTFASFSDDGILMEMGKLATHALADMYGTKYQVGTAADIRQPASGMSHDWAKARAGIKYSYHIDLRDSFGPYGFLLPGSQIVATARETWQAVRAIVDNLES
ncbi:carboxypeptidase A2-like isoform X2 [Leptidea sinapis]|uniref:carboxypeptidase A2-like isoform X2 n=1 Tax=Leptidea sinapis TaxID=189913 RepID=UPI0021C3589C|nr:carboxypeptidase A2-like isoform X2 [Leptidea sinapis]